MTIQEAYRFFENLKIATTKKFESKIYKEFLSILSNLDTRDFSSAEIQSIETELDNMDLESNRAINKKQLTKLLKEFKVYLKETHSLFPADYYTNLGVSFGMAFGIFAGVIFGERFEKSLGISLGIGLGMLIGLIVGRHMDSKVKLEGKVY